MASGRCLHCDQTCLSADDIENHMSKEHIIFCNLCPYAGKTDSDLKSHKAANHPICCLCGYSGKSESDLEDHIDNKHSDIFNPEKELKEIKELKELNQLAKKTSNRKRKLESDKTNNQNKKRKIPCSFCLKDYSNAESLRSHLEKKHPAEQSLPSFLHQLTYMTKKVNGLEKNVATLTQKVNFIEKIRNAEIAEKNAEFSDQKKAHIIRMGGFHWEKEKCENEQNLNLQEKLILKIKQIITRICPTPFSIIRANLYQPQKKTDMVDVSFSESTDVVELFSKLKMYSNLKENKNKIVVERLLSPATRVRFQILQAIGVQIKSKNQTKDWRVNYKGLRPFLHITEKFMEENQFQFSDALLNFGHLLQKFDLMEIKKLCLYYGLTGNNLLQFVVPL